jgi:membrane-bound serine protease (ClpP class)
VAAAIFIIGIIFIILEIMVFPGTILPSLIGLVCVMVALVYTMSGWEMPVSPLPSEGTAPAGFDFNLATYALGLRNFAIGIIGAAIMILTAARYLPQTAPFRHMLLSATAGGTLESTPAMTASRSVQAGDQGRTISALRPCGTVQFGDLRLEAIIESGYLQSGTDVRIREVQGARIIVEALS